MKPELYAMSGSPYSWRVHLALIHMGIEHEVRLLSGAKGELKSDEYGKVNPRKKVPGLKHGDFCLWESAAMLEYLAESFPDATPLYPGSPQAKARLRRIICEIDNYYALGANQLIKNLYFSKPEDWNFEEIAEGKEIAAAELGRLEGEICGDCFAGEALSAADFALYPSLAHIARYELKKPDLGLSEHIGPSLRKMMQRVEAMDGYDASYPPHWKS